MLSRNNKQVAILVNPNHITQTSEGIIYTIEWILPSGNKLIYEMPTAIADIAIADLAIAEV